MKNKADISKNERDKHQEKKGLVAFESVTSWNRSFGQIPVRHVSAEVIK